MIKFHQIFKPIQINQTNIKNRLAVSAMVTNYADESGSPTKRMIDYYVAKAAGGWGLIITEDFPVNSLAGKPGKLPLLNTNEKICQYQEMTQKIHDHGATILAQIYHAGKRAPQKYVPSYLYEAGEMSEQIEMTVEQIQSLTEDFASCAVSAQKAGFDGIEIHCGHGYLLNLFASGLTNKRTDSYGGTIENRIRFTCEIIKKIRKSTSPNFIICCRLTCSEYKDGGINIEEAKAMAMLLEDAGVDVLNVTQGSLKQSHVVIPPSCVARANYIDNAAEIKKVVNIPVIGVGRINDPLIAEEVLLSGKADMVIMARSSIADPNMPNKIKAGNSNDVIRCIGCLQGCTGQNARGNSVRCTVNPMTGRESEYDLSQTKNLKKVYVIGGGVAGCEAAIAAALRGHHVTVLERDNILGGQWRAASVPAGKDEFASFLSWQRQKLESLNVNIRLNTNVTAELINLEHPDVVIIATGSTPSIPPIEGIQGCNILFAKDILLGKKKAGKKVAVIGGGLVGAETALHLAIQGSKVTIVEMLAKIAKDGERNCNYYLMKHLAEKNVKIYTSAKVLSIQENAVVIDHLDKPITIDSLDNIVIATGVKSTRQSANLLLGDFKGTVLFAGDASEVKNGYANIQQGFEIGLSIQ